MTLLLYKQPNHFAGLWFIIPLLCLSILNLINLRIYFLFDLIIWLIIVNINNRIYPTLTGGDYLLSQLLFFNCIISFNYKVTEKRTDQIKMCLHNFAVVSVMIQVCIVYFFAAISKLSNESWLNGSAVSMAAQINHYSLPTISKNTNNFYLLFVIVNYIVLIYQILFPFLIWVKKIKKPFIVVGIVMHLYIAFIMGLVSFGLIMILPYIYFWPRKKQI